MIITLTVFKEVHNTWPAKNGKPAGEAFDLLCMDMSNPAEHRMEEMLYYRTKDEERPRVWGKAVGTTLQVGVRKSAMASVATQRRPVITTKHTKG